MSCCDKQALKFDALGLTKTILPFFPDSRRSFVRLSSSNDNFHNDLLLNNSNTLILYFL